MIQENWQVEVFYRRIEMKLIAWEKIKNIMKNSKVFCSELFFIATVSSLFLVVCCMLWHLNPRSWRHYSPHPHLPLPSCCHVLDYYVRTYICVCICVCVYLFVCIYFMYIFIILYNIANKIKVVLNTQKRMMINYENEWSKGECVWGN